MCMVRQWLTGWTKGWSWDLCSVLSSQQLPITPAHLPITPLQLHLHPPIMPCSLHCSLHNMMHFAHCKCTALPSLMSFCDLCIQNCPRDCNAELLSYHAPLQVCNSSLFLLQCSIFTQTNNSAQRFHILERTHVPRHPCSLLCYTTKHKPNSLFLIEIINSRLPATWTIQNSSYQRAWERWLLLKCAVWLLHCP